MEKSKEALASGKETKNTKLSYEDLEKFARQISVEHQKLSIELNQAKSIIASMNRLDYLLRIIANSNVFSKEFIGTCVKEVEEMMTIPEKEEE